MSVIYEPRGKAREYSELAVNLYKGCSHACVYCYAPAATFCDREKFSSPDYIQPRPDILKTLEREAQKMSGDPRRILLSFTSDPYQPAEQTLGVTRKALKTLMAHGLSVTILTKGGSWGVVRDLDLLKANPHNAWSVTLTHDEPAFSLEWEPGAALPEDRIHSLRIAKEAGINTWVSFEPVLDPEAVYRLLDQTHEFVDFYKVGKLNYHPLAKEIDWPKFKGEMEERLTRLGKPYYLKEDLRGAAVRDGVDSIGKVG